MLPGMGFSFVLKKRAGATIHQLYESKTYNKLHTFKTKSRQDSTCEGAAQNLAKFLLGGKGCNLHPGRL